MTRTLPSFISAKRVQPATGALGSGWATVVALIRALAVRTGVASGPGVPAQPLRTAHTARAGSVKAGIGRVIGLLHVHAVPP